jgi:hypothetical protein
MFNVNCKKKTRHRTDFILGPPMSVKLKLYVFNIKSVDDFFRLAFECDFLVKIRR